MSKPVSVRSLLKTTNTLREVNEALTQRLREKSDALNVVRARLESSETARKNIAPEPLRPGIVAAHAALETLAKTPSFDWFVSFLRDARNAARIASEAHEQRASVTNSVEDYGMLREARARFAVLTAALAAIEP